MKNLCLIVTILVALAIPASVITATPGFSVLPDEMLTDPKLESRAREISKDIRCLVCQNQSIDDSNADLARDLRIIVRERLTAGDSNQQVKDYLVARYGDYVLLTPPVNLETIFSLGRAVSAGRDWDGHYLPVGSQSHTGSRCNANRNQFGSEPGRAAKIGRIDGRRVAARTPY